MSVRTGEGAGGSYPFWTVDELRTRRLALIERFVASWGPHLQVDFEAQHARAAEKVRRLLELSDNLRALKEDPDFFRAPDRRDLLGAARYMTVPILSADNLKVIAEGVGEVEVILRFLNLVRFPWMDGNGGDPDEDAIEQAVEATAELMALQDFGTAQRVERAREQEERVRNQLGTKLTFVPSDEMLKRFREVEYDPALGITPQNLADVLKKGEFTEETLVYGHKSDVPVRLPDGTLLTLECKVSNSATNSYKRLIRETDGKRRAWREAFGAGVLTGAVISGVYSLKNLQDAQREGMLLFFDHELEALDAFIAAGSPRQPST